jgi:hypothetical protein
MDFYRSFVLAGVHHISIQTDYFTPIKTLSFYVVLAGTRGTCNVHAVQLSLHGIVIYEINILRILAQLYFYLKIIQQAVTNIDRLKFLLLMIRTANNISHFVSNS